jgi:hypothetical protein
LPFGRSTTGISWRWLKIHLDDGIDAGFAGDLGNALPDILALVVDAMVGAASRAALALSGDDTVVMTVAPRALANWMTY